MEEREPVAHRMISRMFQERRGLRKWQGNYPRKGKENRLE